MLDVSPYDDGDEDDTTSSSTVTATLAGGTGYSIGSPNSGTVTINEDFTPTVTISATSSSVAEVGGGSGVFTVSFNAPAPTDVTVDYAVSGMTATLQSGSGYTIGNPNSASVTINEEPSQPPPTVTISASTTSMSEMGGSVQLGIDLSMPASSTVTVNYSLSGTAVNRTDYQTLSGQVTISQGQSYAMVPLVAIDDGDGDDNITSESVTVTLQSATGGYTIGSPNSVTVTIQEDSSPPPELLALPRNTANPVTTSVTVPEIRALIPAAAARWEAAGVDRSTIASDLRGLQIIVADLPGSALGEALPGRLWIDTNAAGYGWFIDRTPRNDSEFSDVIAPTELQATGDSPAVGRVDLLTVIMHEMGHLLGLPEASGQESSHDIMSEVLDLSTRRLPDRALTASVPAVGWARQRESPYASS